MNEMKQHVLSQLGTDFLDTLGEQCKPPTFALAAKRLRAIDLSCRACDACGAGAGCWAWIPGGGLRSAPVFTPNLRQAPVNVLRIHWFHEQGIITGTRRGSQSLLVP